MTTEHPITPPWALIAKWRKEWTTNTSDRLHQCNYVANQAARWGADQELEACCKWTSIVGGAEALRAARRPKPPSLAEQALGALEQIDVWAVANMNHLSIHDDLVTGVDAIRSALERLKELEKGNG